MTTLEHERRLTEVEDRSKSNKHRLNKIEEKQTILEELAISVKVLATRQENVEGDVKEIKSDVKELTSKPGKRSFSFFPAGVKGVGKAPRINGTFILKFLKIRS